MWPRTTRHLLAMPSCPHRVWQRFRCEGSSVSRKSRPQLQHMRTGEVVETFRKKHVALRTTILVAGADEFNRANQLSGFFVRYPYFGRVWKFIQSRSGCGRWHIHRCAVATAVPPPFASEEGNSGSISSSIPMSISKPPSILMLSSGDVTRGQKRVQSDGEFGNPPAVDGSPRHAVGRFPKVIEQRHDWFSLLC